MHIRSVRLLHDCYPTRDDYPFNLEIFQETDSLEFQKAVTFFIGENGTGKSTLLAAIARACGIAIWEDTDGRRFHYNRFEQELYRCIRIGWIRERVPGAFFASEIFRNFARLLDEWAAADPDLLHYFGSESLMEKSHGQSHMAFFRSRFRIKGLYLLDEPENALSPRMQLQLLGLLREIGAAGDAQFIIATHSPLLLACPDAEIFSFDARPIRRVSYEDTDHYRICRDFLNDYRRYLADR
ncbi:MAG: AAA family ATPase [Methanomicrobiales archaeon]|nr:AAA family ATPase [Methanomicrobiales archaeon]MDI6875442.1 AAA family ATPase [Methanomicrobiales archaeon]